MIYIENPQSDKDVEKALGRAFNRHAMREPWDGYKRAVEYHERLEVHTEGETTSAAAQNLLYTQRPNEPKEIRDYRVANLSAITEGAYQKVLNVMSVIFHPELFSVYFPDMPANVTDTAESYMMTDIGEDGNIVKWAKSTLIHESLSDPNGYIVVVPYPSEDGMAWREVDVEIFCAEDVMHKDDWYLFTEDSKEAIYVDARSIWKVYKSGNGYEWELLHLANEDMVFCYPLPHRKKGDLKQSYIHGALPYWEKALQSDSDLTAVKVRSAFPRQWTARLACSAKGCNGGKVFDTFFDASKNEMVKVEAECGSCGGTGLMKADSPYGGYEIDFTNPALDKMPTPPLGFVSPPTDIINLVDEQVKQNMNEGYSALNMDFLRRDEKAGESGEAKTISRQELNNFLLDFSANVYDCLAWTCSRIVYFRYGAAYPNNWREFVPIWSPPTYFGVVSADSAIDRISKVNTGKLNQSLSMSMQKDFAELEFGEKSMEAKLAKAKLDLDPLLDKSIEEIQALTADIRPEDLYIHANLNRLLRDAMDTGENWLDQPRKAKMDWLYKTAKAEMTARQPMIPAEE